MSKDPDYHRCVELFTGLHLAKHQMLLPAPTVAEVGYLLGTRAAPTPTPGHLRMAELVEKYANLPLGTSDASVIVIVIAERLADLRRHSHWRGSARPAAISKLLLASQDQLRF